MSASRAYLAPRPGGVVEGCRGGPFVPNEFSGPRAPTPTPVCGTAPPKSRLWIYEKEASVPQPESSLALFSSLEGVRTWVGGKACRSLSVSHPCLGELDARLDCCHCCFPPGKRATTVAWTRS